MTPIELSNALHEAVLMMRAADLAAERTAAVLCGRLRFVDDSTILRRLKRELRDFDMVTGRWKVAP